MKTLNWIIRHNREMKLDQIQIRKYSSLLTWSEGLQMLELMSHKKLKARQRDQDRTRLIRTAEIIYKLGMHLCRVSIHFLATIRCSSSFVISFFSQKLLLCLCSSRFLFKRNKKEVIVYSNE